MAFGRQPRVPEVLGESNQLVDLGEAAEFAESSPEPAPAELYTDVLVDSY